MYDEVKLLRWLKSGWNHAPGAVSEDGYVVGNIKAGMPSTCEVARSTGQEACLALLISLTRRNQRRSRPV